MTDAFSGYVAFSAILVALLERGRDGRGRHVTVSMLESALVLQTASVLSAHSGGERLRRRSDQARFMARDRRIYVNLMFPKWYRAVCTIIGRPDLLHAPWGDPARRDAAGLEFVREVEKSLAARTAQEWEREFTAAGVPASVVRDPEEILAHEQVTKSGLLLDALDVDGHPMTIFDLPFRIDGVRGAPVSPGAPRLGEQTAAALSRAEGPASS
jgi:CoA:oxalate CoA-transferase